jgi:hypothetical protein
MSRLLVTTTAILSLALAGCGGGSDSTPSRTNRLAALGLVRGPPANLVANCKGVAKQAGLTVYCPPVVPKGKVDARLLGDRKGNVVSYGERDDYGLSLSSESLTQSPHSFKSDPAEGHWVLAASRPARRSRELIDNRIANPNHHYPQQAKHFTVQGIRATVLPVGLASGAFASADHELVYWRIGNAIYLASAHAAFFSAGRTSSGERRTNDASHHYAPIVEAIARGLIRETAGCRAGDYTPGSAACRWVFPGAG